MSESVGAFRVYDVKHLEDMTRQEIQKTFSMWWDFDTMEVAIGRPSALLGLLVKIMELRRENTTLRGLAPKEPCELCGDTGIIPTTRSLGRPGGSEIVAYHAQPCHLCEEEK